MTKCRCYPVFISIVIIDGDRSFALLEILCFEARDAIKSYAERINKFMLIYQALFAVLIDNFHSIFLTVKVN